MGLISWLKQKREMLQYMTDVSVGSKARTAWTDDFNQWMVHCQGWNPDQLHTVPGRYAIKYMQQVYTKGGIGSWKNKKS